MKHEVRDEGDITVVVLRGDVDLESSPPARKVLLESIGRGRPLVVDMSEVSYIDSSGVASLVEALQASRKGGVRFALVQVSEAAMRILKLARLDSVFTIHDSLDDATRG